MAFMSYLPVGKDKLCETRTPLSSGELIVFRTTLEDDSCSKDVFAMILKQNSKVARAFDVKVIAAARGCTRWHFIERTDAPPIFVLRLPKAEKEAITYQSAGQILENATRWRSIAAPTVAIQWDLVPWIAKEFHRPAEQDIALWRKCLQDEGKKKVHGPPRLTQFLSVTSTSVHSLFGDFVFYHHLVCVRFDLFICSWCSCVRLFTLFRRACSCFSLCCFLFSHFSLRSCFSFLGCVVSSFDFFQTWGWMGFIPVVSDPYGGFLRYVFRL